MHFDDLHLIEPLLRAVRGAGYERPSPIQQQAIPHILAGKDMVGCAQTGTGKTAAFVLPILQNLDRARVAQSQRQSGRPRVLILSPTRELAAQIGDSIRTYGRHLGMRHSVIFGGVGQEPQVRLLRQGVDLLVATPGRLLDLMGQGFVKFDGLEVFVLDEADRMLDMGFIHDVKRIVEKLPTKRQTLLFSATMPEDIRALAARILRDPVRVEVTPPATTADRIDQSLYRVAKADKRALLVDVLADRAITRALVFTRTKHGANRLVEHLARTSIQAVAIHGNKSQGARERALAGFKSGDIRVLVATDIAARGIDVDGISHVINFDLPEVAETYVHRIGRTARAGAAGISLSFCDVEEREYLQQIEKLIRKRIPVQDHRFADRADEPAPPPPPRGPRPQRHEPRHDGARRGHHDARPPVDREESSYGAAGQLRPHGPARAPAGHQHPSPARSSGGGGHGSGSGHGGGGSGDGGGGHGGGGRRWSRRGGRR